MKHGNMASRLGNPRTIAYYSYKHLWDNELGSASSHHMKTPSPWCLAVVRF